MSVLDRITEYLSLGGLINPELMEHEKVRDLIMDCRDEINSLAGNQAKAFNDFEQEKFDHKTTDEYYKDREKKLIEALSEIAAQSTTEEELDLKGGDDYENVDHKEGYEWSVERAREVLSELGVEL